MDIICTKPHDVIFQKNVILIGLVGFEVLTAVVTTSSIFWDITPCSPLQVNLSFGRTYRLHLQARISQARNKPEAVCDCHLLRYDFFLGLFFEPED
jgi:hypothetical protein